MTKIYIYKLTVDDGGAPCVRDDMLSLAICKPAIRSAAEQDSVILGFAGYDLYKDNGLVYAAKVSKPLDARNYFSERQYETRPDCIYQWDGNRFEWKEATKNATTARTAHNTFIGACPQYTASAANGTLKGPHIRESQSFQNALK
jgi:hypothetical protein